MKWKLFVCFRQAIFSNVLFSYVVVLLRAQGLFKVGQIRGLFLRETVSLGWLGMWAGLAGIRANMWARRPHHPPPVPQGWDSAKVLRQTLCVRHWAGFLSSPGKSYKVLLIAPIYWWVNWGSGFPGGSVIKNPCANAGDMGLIPWVRKISWRNKLQSTPVFLPGKCHEQKSLAGYSLWGHKESDIT